MSEQRKLATIMSVDVAGYSRAAEADDGAAAQSVGRLREAINTAIAPHGGRIFNTAGDGFMIEFPSAASGVAAAQALLAEANVPRVRIGLHLGDVIVSENGDLLGHGVNVAARLQALAEPGTVVLSEPVQAPLSDAAKKSLRSLGRVQLDKMVVRLDVFAIAPNETRFTRVLWKRGRLPLLALVTALVVVIGGFFTWRAMAPPEAPRLAVLRFENLGDTEPYFAEGVADELITELSRVRGMQVTARASSFALTGERATPAVAARELGARFVLTGSVRRLPEAIRLNANLVEAPSGRVVWSQAFEGPSTDAFVLQRQLAVQVAQAVGTRLSAPPPHRVDAEAYQLYLQARELQTRSVSRNWRDVRDLYRSAVDRDPTFVQAWVALARAEANVANEAIDSGLPDTAYTSQMLAPALAAAQRAISLDDGLAEPYLVRSTVYSWLGDWRLAAAALHEGEARGGQSGAAFYRAVGYLQESRRARQESTSLDPLSADEWTNLAFTCEYVDDKACHLAAAQRAHELAPQDSSAARGLVRALIANDRRDDAWTLIEQMHWATGTDLSSRVLRWQAGHGRAPQPAEVTAALDHGEYLDVAVGLLADMHDWDAAAHLLERWGPPSRSYIFALFRVQWAPLRRTPQFWALMQRSGLVQFWRESGRWPDFCEQDAGDVCAPYRR